MGKRKKVKVVRPVILQAVHYDATREPPSLRNHWAYADSKSVDASLSPEVRQRLRNRARYEIANNSYAFGVALTIANNVVGSGPRLQILNEDDSKQAANRAREIEWAFDMWAQEIRLAEKLRSMRFSRFQDGEAFAILHNNPLLTGVQLDVSPIDCDRVQAEVATTSNPLDIDGVIVDQWGNPVKYRVLDDNPGDETGTLAIKATIYDAKNVVHWFRRNTAEQHRGVTELAASLNLFALLRRYTESVVTAAETAADLAMVFTTDATEDEASYQYSSSQADQPGQTTEIKPRNAADFPEMQFRKGMSLTLPEGWNVSQLRAEQPTTTYSDFKRELLGEIGRSLQIPVNIIAGDSARYNYASGRLDHQEFQKQIRLDQALCRSSVMTPIFNAWYREWALMNGRDSTKIPVAQWYFDGFEHVDPVKEANAQAIRLSSGSTNLMIECGKNGLDWEEVMQQRAREVELAKSLGIVQEEPSVVEDRDDRDEENEREKSN